MAAAACSSNAASCSSRHAGARSLRSVPCICSSAGGRLAGFSSASTAPGRFIDERLFFATSASPPDVRATNA